MKENSPQGRTSFCFKDHPRWGHLLEPGQQNRSSQGQDMGWLMCEALGLSSRFAVDLRVTFNWSEPPTIELQRLVHVDGNQPNFSVVETYGLRLRAQQQ